jgi:hypothetical protein
MLIVQVNGNRNIQVTFDVTGKGEDVICYYIREVKLKLKSCYWNNKQEQVNGLKSVLYEIPYCSSTYTESKNELILTLHFKKLMGFYNLAFFQTAIEDQFNEIMKVLRKVLVDDTDAVYFEIVLDVIY